jgi:signal transduction histidine kinase
MVTRLHRWFDRHPLAGDHLIAAVTALLVLGELVSGRVFSSETYVALTTGEVLVSLALVAPLAFGPRAPVAVFGVVMVLCGVQIAITEHVLIADLSALVALYFLIAHGPSRLKPVGLAVALLGGAVLAARASIPGVLDKPGIGTIVVSAEVLVAALLADRRVSRRERLVALEIERDQQAELGAAQERARIARELHDVVAHSLAVMVAQADGGRYAAPAGPAAAALEQIGDTGREALEQMRALLGVLRAEEEHPDLPRLVRRLAGAGLPVELEVEGAERPLPPELQRSLHRIAQEALTNVLKHAQSPRRVEVVLRYLDDPGVELTVRDDGRGHPAADGDGHGLTGMRERVALHNGSLHAGPQAGGGFEVRARIPA